MATQVLKPQLRPLVPAVAGLNLQLWNPSPLHMHVDMHPWQSWL